MERNLNIGLACAYIRGYLKRQKRLGYIELNYVSSIDVDTGVKKGHIINIILRASERNSY